MDDIFAALKYEGFEDGFELDQGIFYPAIKADPKKYVRKITPSTKRWIKSMRDEGKFVFLGTSSTAEYAKFILQNILVDDNGEPEDYWKYFDICLSDAKKPNFFTKDAPFLDVETGLPAQLVSGKWYADGKYML